MSDLEDVIREKIAEIDLMLLDALRKTVPWSVSDATYYDRWMNVRVNLNEALELANLPTVARDKRLRLT